MPAKKFYVYKKSRYTDICLGVRPVIKVGNSGGITIKKSQMKSYGIKPGDEFVVCLIKRVWRLSDELSDNELREYAQFKKWKKEKNKEIDEAVEDIINSEL
jgi:hypothetical protein